MDGKVLLLIGVALIGGAWLAGSAGFSVGEAPPAEDAVTVAHREMRAQIEQAGRDPSDPESFLLERDGKLLVAGPIAATEHLEPAFIEDVVSGYVRPGPADLPGTVEAVAALEGCRPTPPAEGSRVANVRAGRPAAEISFYGWSAAEIAELAPPDIDRAADEQGAMDSLPGAIGTPQAAPGRYRLADVAVLSDSVPVHLVLQAGEGRVLWNIHAASGAQITGITLLGGYLPAIANSPKNVPIEIFDSAAMAECGLLPSRRKRAGDPIFRVRSGKEDAVRAELTTLDAAVEAWNIWFAARFGPRSDDTLIGFDMGMVAAAIGPLPEDRLHRASYRSLAGAKVVLAQGAESRAVAPEKADKALAEILASKAEGPAGGFGWRLLAGAKEGTE